MKKITLMRHAKSSWNELGVPDIHRAITPKGVKRTERVCSFLKEQQLNIDAILCSPALRAQQTSDIVMAQLEIDQTKKETIDNIFHLSRFSEFETLIFSLDPTIDHVLFLGHNPFLTMVANSLSPNLTEWFPTSGVASFSYSIDYWTNFAAVKPTLAFFTTPTLLKK